MIFSCQECEVERSNGLSMAIHQKIEHDIDSDRFSTLELTGDVHELQKELNQVKMEIKNRLRWY